MGAASVGRRASAEMGQTTQAAQVGAGIGPNEQLCAVLTVDINVKGI